MAVRDRQESVWGPVNLEAIWEPDRDGKFPNGSPEYWFFLNVFEQLDSSLLRNFKAEVTRANTAQPKATGFLEWQNVWGERTSYTDSIEKVFAGLYNRRSPDQSWITKGVKDDRYNDLVRHEDNPDRAFESHKRIYKWWVCIYALFQILSKFGFGALTRQSISDEAGQELQQYKDFDNQPITEHDPVFKGFQNRL